MTRKTTKELSDRYLELKAINSGKYDVYKVGGKLYFIPKEEPKEIEQKKEYRKMKCWIENIKRACRL